MTAFSWDGRHLPDLAALRGYMADMNSKTAWIQATTVHHTWRPTIANWQASGGVRQMASLEKTYRAKRPAWPGGPGLFVAPDGYWIGTPWNVAGVHAGECNSTHLGIEVVGNYDDDGWQEPIRSLALQAIAAILVWKNLPVTSQTVAGHRECLPNKSCPGDAVHMDALRAAVRAAMGIVRTSPDHEQVWAVAAGHTNVRAQPRVERGNVLTQLGAKTRLRGYGVQGTAPDGETNATWVRFVWQQQTAYVWSGLVTPLPG